MQQHDIRYIALGAIYLVVGMVLGIVMGIQQDFALAPVHAHINLVGFAAHSVFGLVYKAWPGLKQGTAAIVGSILVCLGALLFFLITAGTLLRGRMN